MLAKALRAALFTGLVLALWTFARPARADVSPSDVLARSLAPFCDDRGATALAPPPALEPTDEVLLRASAPPSDAGDEGQPSFGASLRPAHRVIRTKAAQVVPVPVPSPTAVPPSPVSALVLFEREALPPAGVRFRIERPPRG